MKTTTKRFAAIAAILALGGTGLVLASPGNHDRGHGMGMGMGMHGGDHGARGHGSDTNASLVALKTELAITASQENAWQAYESIVRQQAEARKAQRDGMRAQMQSADARSSADHEAQRASMMKLRDSQNAERDGARQALLAVLTPGQKALAERRLMAGQREHRGEHGAPGARHGHGG